jgi:energy-coupling factor transporter ATP-binding protein EcfA2
LALIEVDNLTFGYPRMPRPVLDALTTQFAAGERVAVLAPNGGGKTTLARWLAGLFPDGVLQAQRGEVRLAGRPLAHWPLAERTAAIQFVGQVPEQQLSGAAFTVSDEIAFGPCNLGLPPAEVARRVAAALAIGNLTGLAGRNPFTLSGGEQQRLSIAAALAMEPRVLVLDEPTSNLDPESRESLRAQLAALPAGLTVIVCEVALRPSLAFARRFLLLDAGRIVADGDAASVLGDPRCVATLGHTPVAATAAEIRAAGWWPETAPLPLTLHDGVAAFARAADVARR